jgi:hypothetical protein
MSFEKLVPAMIVRIPSPIRRKNYLVYSLPLDWQPRACCAMDADVCWADSESIEQLFGNDSVLRHRFLEMHRRGYLGLFQCLRGQWVGYAWATRPEHNGPDHLRLYGTLPSYWIHHCGTRESYRGRGLYKRSLNLLADHIRRGDANAPVLIDTTSDNLPARAAIAATGFGQHGIARTWNLTVARGRSWSHAKWCMDQLHPPTATKMHAVLAGGENQP